MMKWERNLVKRPRKGLRNNTNDWRRENEEMVKKSSEEVKERMLLVLLLDSRLLT